MTKYYITTPIYYVNDVPHVGHAYTTLAADILARYYRLGLGEKNVFFLTGTDEHGANVAQAAEKHGKSPKEYADEVVTRFKEAWNLLNIVPDHFIRTTDRRHEKVAQNILQKIYDNKYIRPGTYEGWYCIGCEKFLLETDLVDGKCPLHLSRKPVFQKENNYFLKLKKIVKDFDLYGKVKRDEYKIFPPKRRHEILSRLAFGVEDISISRAGVSWGIPLPWDKSQTIYVWVEALLNYFSATQFLDEKSHFWPPDVQFMAKDIVWFHSVIWQCLLLAAGIKEIPHTIFAHGFFTINGQKMSKSLGNVISPKDLVDRYGVDGARYLLLSAAPFGEDGDISIKKFDTKYNANLANGLGNLVARIEKLAELNKFDPNKMIQERNNTLLLDVGLEIQLFRLDKALEHIWGAIRGLDNYLERDRTWKKTASEAKKSLGEIIIGSEAVTSIKEIAEALGSFMPETAKEILRRFSQPTIKSQPPLFPRIQ